MPRIASLDGGHDASRHRVVSDLSLGKVPTKADRLKDSEGQTIAKLCGESEWQPRFLVITWEKLTISHPDQDDVSEQIPLHEIASCDRMTGQGENIIAFVINTIEGGYNCGRQYIFAVEHEIMFREWHTLIEIQSEICFKRMNKHTMLEEARVRARHLLRSTAWQYTFGLIIVANFVVNIGQACIDVGTSSTSAKDETDLASLHRSNVIFNGFDITFTLLFSIELVLNLFGNWFWDFVRSGWSLFDFSVVLVSIISLAVPDGPQWILVLRTMRIFRILRLFNKMRVLRTIINALLAALPIVAQAFLIMALCVFVFAIVGQNLFMKLAPENFGNFQVSLYSIFQVLTLDKWGELAEAVKDKNKFGAGDIDPTSAVFFCCLIITCVWVLLPVIVAVLLDNFVTSCRTEEKQAAIDEEADEMRKAGVSKAITLSPIYGLLESLSKFKNSRDLSHKIQALFQVLDCDRGGTLSFQEMSEGLKRMNFSPPIAMSQDDFIRMTNDGEFCDEEDSLDPVNFESMMRGELEDHIERKVAKAYEESQKNETPESTALLASVKLLKMLTGQDSTPLDVSEELEQICSSQKELLEVIGSIKEELLLEIKGQPRVRISQGRSLATPPATLTMQQSNVTLITLETEVRGF